MNPRYLDVNYRRAIRYRFSLSLLTLTRPGREARPQKEFANQRVTNIPGVPPASYSRSHRVRIQFINISAISVMKSYLLTFFDSSEILARIWWIFMKKKRFSSGLYSAFVNYRYIYYDSLVIASWRCLLLILFKLNLRGDFQFTFVCNTESRRYFNTDAYTNSLSFKIRTLLLFSRMFWKNYPFIYNIVVLLQLFLFTCKNPWVYMYLSFITDDSYIQ